LALIQEREPLKLEEFPGMVQSWLLAAGGFAALGLLIWMLFQVARLVEPGGYRRRPTLRPGWLVVAVVGGAVLMLVPPALRVLWNALGWIDPTNPPGARSTMAQPFKDLFAMGTWDLGLLFGACSVLVLVLLPVLTNVPRLRMRRIWALAKLSFKEALRRRVLWGFSFFILIFLFASWFLPYKPEDQVRNYVRAVHWAMTPLLLLTAGLLAAFSIPGDLKSQTMYTIVTKPVERFEILLGRFLGYTLLMTLVIVVMNLLGLVYVARGVDEEAAEESLRARVPVYGQLTVKNPKNVGYEWEYRQYITGSSEDEAVYTFPSLPRDLAERTEPVRCEFTFDIFRTTKGEENKGVFCTFIFENWQWDPKRLDEYGLERSKILDQPDPAVVERGRREGWSAEKRLAVLNEGLAEKFGYYELPSKEVVDFHTLSVEVPAGLFKNLTAYDARSARPPLRVVVRCESPTQYLGVARHDFYIVDRERSFAANFLKGGALSLWFRVILVIGLALTCSTYLSGVIAFLVAMVIYLLGNFLDFIETVAQGKALGGGPVENFIRLATGAHTSVPLEESPGVTLAKAADFAFQRALSLVYYFFPDVDRFDLTDYVANGFDVGGGHLIVTALFLAGYLLPWMILGFYLMRSREVAS
jgi:hypothetical protein